MGHSPTGSPTMPAENGLPGLECVRQTLSKFAAWAKASQTFFFGGSTGKFALLSRATDNEMKHMSIVNLMTSPL